MQITSVPKSDVLRLPDQDSNQSGGASITHNSEPPLLRDATLFLEIFEAACKESSYQLQTIHKCSKFSSANLLLA